MAVRTWLRARGRDLTRMETKDWVATLSAVATTILAVISVIISSNLSPIQDFYYSEMAKGNTEVVAVRKEAAALQAQSENLAQRIKEQEAALAESITKAADAESRFAKVSKSKRETEQSLDFRLRVEAMRNYLNQLSTTEADKKLQEDQQITFDYGREAKERLRDQARKAVGTELEPYFVLLTDEMPKVCPELFAIQVSYPTLLPASPESSDTAQRTEIISRRMTLMLKRREAILNDLRTRSEVAAPCLCSVLDLQGCRTSSSSAEG